MLDVGCWKFSCCSGLELEALLRRARAEEAGRARTGFDKFQQTFAVGVHRLQRFPRNKIRRAFDDVLSAGTTLYLEPHAAIEHWFDPRENRGGACGGHHNVIDAHLGALTSGAAHIV